MIRPALVGLGVTGLLCSCSSPVKVVESPPLPMAPAVTRVVLPPETTTYVVSWLPQTGRITYTVRYGWREDAITNVFATTEDYMATNTVLEPDWSDGFYVTVTAMNAYGISDPSYIEKYGGYPINGVEIDSIPPNQGQVLLFQSPNLRHWVGYITRLPVTNAVTDTTFYRVEPLSGAAGQPLRGDNALPIELTIKGLRLWNPDKKHYGG